MLDGKPVEGLNELEYIKGEIFANVWQTDDIVRIDAQDVRFFSAGGRCAATCSALKPPHEMPTIPTVMER